MIGILCVIVRWVCVGGSFGVGAVIRSSNAEVHVIRWTHISIWVLSTSHFISGWFAVDGGRCRFASLIWSCVQDPLALR